MAGDCAGRLCARAECTVTGTCRGIAKSDYSVQPEAARPYDRSIKRAGSWLLRARRGIAMVNVPFMTVFSLSPLVSVAEPERGGPDCHRSVSEAAATRTVERRNGGTVERMVPFIVRISAERSLGQRPRPLPTYDRGPPLAEPRAPICRYCRIPSREEISSEDLRAPSCNCCTTRYSTLSIRWLGQGLALEHKNWYG